MQVEEWHIFPPKQMVVENLEDEGMKRAENEEAANEAECLGQKYKVGMQEEENLWVAKNWLEKRAGKMNCSEVG